MAHPISPVRASSGPPLEFAHPTPDLQSLQGAYVGNIERLEEHAERMSSRGSDIAVEIRKLQLEQKLSDSRRSSLQSGYVDDSTRPAAAARSRNHSTSSYANSILDVNNAARWGGYSPGGFVGSPVGSPHSGSFSQAPPSHRQRSGSRASRLGQVIRSDDEDDPQVNNGQGTTSAQYQLQQSDNHGRPPSNHSASSFARAYDQAAQEIHDNFNNMETFSVQNDFPDRPPTAASTDTYQQARTLFTDFDGVHCEATIEEEEIKTPRSSNSQMRDSVQLLAQAHPPPADNMVFYPAPVPKTLNLPKRLSQLPAATVQARRRTQLLEAMTAENRKSTTWVADTAHGNTEGAGEGSNRNRKSIDARKSMDPRRSRMSLAGLPPQLRASAFFDQPAPVQEFEVKGESAADTLENILDASAHAPVSAFTDHPIAGHVGSEVYGKEKNRRSTVALAQDKPDDRKRRSSLNLLDTRRNSSGDPLNKLKKRSSSQDLNRLMVRESTSRMSLSAEFEGEPIEGNRDHEPSSETTPTLGTVDGLPQIQADDDDVEEDAEEEEEEEEEEEQEQPPEPQYFGAPTTLLAELQLRKQQQKSRNRTAATAFPNGMHSTLLELDAVAEIEKKKRHAARVALAWEAPEEKPHEDDDSDDDVPLGVLFPGREGLANKAAPNHVSDWDRPLGLIAQRELEDHEPLSKRRERLVGGNPNKSTLSLTKRRTQLDLPVPTLTPPQPESDEEEGETLAQRLRRLKNREALDSTVADARKSTVSGEFASELLSQLGATTEDGKATSAPAPEDPEEETLGQRRARLQAEALARGDQPSTSSRPSLKTSHSLADILSAHPIDNSNIARKVSDEAFVAAMPQGSLLRENEMRQSRLKAGRWDQNRMSSYGSLDKPLLDIGRSTSDQGPDRKPISPLPQGSLLQQNEVRQTRLKADMLDNNRRVSSFGNFDKPLLGDMTKTGPEPAIAAKIQAYKGMGMGGPSAASTPSMMFMPPMMGGMYPAMNMAGQRDSYFPGPSMPMTSPFGMGMAPMGYPAGNMIAPQMMAMGMPVQNVYQQMGGGAQAPLGAAMPMQMNMSMQPPSEPMMDPRQRDLIDRWRQSVMP